MSAFSFSLKYSHQQSCTALPQRIVLLVTSRSDTGPFQEATLPIILIRFWKRSNRSLYGDSFVFSTCAHARVGNGIAGYNVTKHWWYVMDEGVRKKSIHSSSWLILVVIMYLINLLILYRWNDRAINLFIERWPLFIALWPSFLANSKGAYGLCLPNSIVCFGCVTKVTPLLYALQA